MFAHVGKAAERRRAEAPLVGRASGRSASPRRWASRPRPSCRQSIRVDCNLRRGALAGGLALPGLRRTPAPGCSPCGQTLTGRIRLRCGSTGCALPLVPRPDGRALRARPARCHRPWRRSVPLRRNQADGERERACRGRGILPTWAKLICLGRHRLCTGHADCAIVEWRGPGSTAVTVSVASVLRLVVERRSCAGRERVPQRFSGTW